MGRKSIAPQRQEEILDAFEHCIEKYGFSNSSTHRISEAANMKQPMIAHYFGNKRAMIDALVQRIMIDYISRLQKKLGNATGELRIQRLLDFIFGPGVLGGKAKRKVLIQLLAAAPHDEKLRVQMQSMYQSFIEVAMLELQQAFPDIAPEKLKEGAYGILCLAVGNDTILLTAVPYANRKYARQCAEALISGLTS
jgi:AcrR family transcriptional regulator